MKNKRSFAVRFLFPAILILVLTTFTSCLSSCLSLLLGGDTTGTADTHSADQTEDVSDAQGGGGQASAYFTVRFYKDGKPLGDGQSIKSGNRVLEPSYTLEDNAAFDYTMIGWDANGDEVPESFPYTVTENTEFHLLYTKTEKTYTVTIFDRDNLLSTQTLAYGSLIDYPTVKSSVTEEKEVLLFRGWSYDGVYDGYLYPYVTKSVRIDAVYVDGQILTLYFGGYVYFGEKLAGDSLNFEADFEISPAEGKIIRYYTDDAYTVPFTGTCMPAGNLTLYAREESASASVPTVHVASREEILPVFQQNLLNRETKMEFSLDYAYSENELDVLLPYLENGSVSLCGYGISSQLQTGILTLDMTYPAVATQTSGDPCYTQTVSLNVGTHTSARTPVFDDFASDRRSLSFPVKNSDALYYALEHGYRPDIDKDAQEVIALYNTMKIFLRRAVDDDMTDLQKVRAIYEKLVLETVYDKAVLEMVTAGAEDMNSYRAFSLEGVFLDHLAVCDGISKAFSSLCAMEGIDCIRVSGKTVDTNGPHAWNKVKLDGNWYVVDATAGGTIIGTEEVLTYAYFLRSDASYSAHAVADGKDYPDVHADSDYPFYDTLTATIGGESYQLSVETAEQGAAILSAVHAAYPLDKRSLDLKLNFGDNISAAVNAMIDAAGISMSIHYAESLGSVIIIFN